MKRRLARLGLGALIGVLAAATALGTGELVAAFTGPATAPALAVGTALIDLAPVSAKEFAIREFGTNDKPVLIGAVLIVLAAVAMVAGALALRRPWLGAAVVTMLGVAGMAAAAISPVATGLSVLPSLAAAVAGAATLMALARPRPASTGRRALLIAGVAAAAWAGGRLLQGNSGSANVRIPPPAEPAPQPPAGHEFPVAGLTPYRTSTKDFYRVDTDLVLPQVSPDEWTLRVHGMVDHELRLSFADILRRPLVERDLTLSCVSNEIGGPYVGNARWTGIPLASLLREAGARPGAEQLLSTAVDGMTIGSPAELVLDGRDALLAVAMNGVPLPVEHGFPARLIVPGLFGYASATKWVRELNLTTFAEQPYWVRRGYDRTGLAKTGSRIDVPRAFARVPAGPVTVAGVAYAQHRGIATVQVRFDGGPWRDAELTSQVSPDTWRQWRYRWEATPGAHRIEVRAADGRGQMQPEQRAPVFPSGATGWESIVVTVTA
ncbi:molybdopterin-dependent oxidoreductase [Amycolatopsis sp. GM8]|uniref:molybdopterin-dependent oxidoreductase n=1 Tax=Amycolatopsis sp. GM8 TaxID=2896530 RepID=UPI001F3E1F23|nr:molybdopterin-dependent oxidoreductase [Amycolatopsis sp. GM8]